MCCTIYPKIEYNINLKNLKKKVEIKNNVLKSRESIASKQPRCFLFSFVLLKRSPSSSTRVFFLWGLLSLLSGLKKWLHSWLIFIKAFDFDRNKVVP